MDAVTGPEGVTIAPGFVSLASLGPGSRGSVVSVGSSAAPLSALERRLLEFGFVHGEQVEIVAEARPGRDPFVVRVGHTTLALRRREAQSVWISLHDPEPDARSPAHTSEAPTHVRASGAGTGPAP